MKIRELKKGDTFTASSESEGIKEVVKEWEGEGLPLIALGEDRQVYTYVDGDELIIWHKVKEEEKERYLILDEKTLEIKLTLEAGRDDLAIEVIKFLSKMTEAKAELEGLGNWAQNMEISRLDF